MIDELKNKRYKKANHLLKFIYQTELYGEIPIQKLGLFVSIHFGPCSFSSLQHTKNHQENLVSINIQVVFKSFLNFYFYLISNK